MSYDYAANIIKVENFKLTNEIKPRRVCNISSIYFHMKRTRAGTSNT